MDQFYVGRTCLELYPFLLAFKFIEIQVLKVFHNDRLDFSAILLFLFLILFTCVFSPFLIKRDISPMELRMIFSIWPLIQLQL